MIYGVDAKIGPVPFGFLSTGSDGPILTIRGTQMPGGSLVEWMDDFDAFLEPVPYGPDDKWHRGFGAVFNSPYVVTPDSKVHDFAVYLSGFVGLLCHGHSLGAPLATYAAVRLRTQPPVLFASPKAGDSEFRDYAQSVTGGPARSYANPNDAVPKVPITVDFPWKLEDFQQVAPFIVLQAFSVSPPIPSDWASSHNLDSYRVLLEAAA